MIYDYHYWGFDSCFFPAFSQRGVTVPLSSGDRFYIEFLSRAWSIFSAGAEMAWDIVPVAISGFGTAIERTTWAGIKNTF